VRLWVDDERCAPPGWRWAHNSDLAITALSPGEVQEISLDHDLGGEDTTRRVVTWMIENGVWPQRVCVHTANPVGRSWLVGTIRRYAPEGVELRVETTCRRG
jgi:hypothetical protein